MTVALNASAYAPSTGQSVYNYRGSLTPPRPGGGGPNALGLLGLLGDLGSVAGPSLEMANRPNQGGISSLVSTGGNYQTPHAPSYLSPHQGSNIGGSPATYAPHQGSYLTQGLGLARLGLRGYGSLTGSETGGYGGMLTVLQSMANLFAEGTPGGNAGLRRIVSAVPFVGPLLSSFIPADENPWKGAQERGATAAQVLRNLTGALESGDLNAPIPGGGRAGDLLASMMSQNLSGAYSEHPWGWDPNPAFQPGLEQLMAAGYQVSPDYTLDRIGSLGELIAASGPINPKSPWVGVGTWEDILRQATQGITGQEIGSTQRNPIEIRPGVGLMADRAFQGTSTTGLAAESPTSNEMIFGSNEFGANPGALAAIRYSLGRNPEQFGFTQDMVNRMASGQLTEDSDEWQQYRRTNAPPFGPREVQMLARLDPFSYGPPLPGLDPAALEADAQRRYDLTSASA